MVSFVSRGVSVLPAVSLYHGVIPAVCWYFFCFAGRHSRLAGISLIRRAVLAPCRYFFCPAGRHSRLADTSSAPQGDTRALRAFLCSAGRYSWLADTSSAPQGGTRAFAARSRAFARHSSPYGPPHSCKHDEGGRTGRNALLIAYADILPYSPFLVQLLLLW